MAAGACFCHLSWGICTRLAPPALPVWDDTNSLSAWLARCLSGCPSIHLIVCWLARRPLSHSSHSSASLLPFNSTCISLPLSSCYSSLNFSRTLQTHSWWLWLCKNETSHFNYGNDTFPDTFPERQIAPCKAQQKTSPTIQNCENAIWNFFSRSIKPQTSFYCMSRHNSHKWYDLV